MTQCIQLTVDWHEESPAPSTLVSFARYWDLLDWSLVFLGFTKLFGQPVGEHHDVLQSILAESEQLWILPTNCHRADAWRFSTRSNIVAVLSVDWWPKILWRYQLSSRIAAASPFVYHGVSKFSAGPVFAFEIIADEQRNIWEYSGAPWICACTWIYWCSHRFESSWYHNSLAACDCRHFFIFFITIIVPFFVVLFYGLLLLLRFLHLLPLRSVSAPISFYRRKPFWNFRGPSHGLTVFIKI